MKQKNSDNKKRQASYFSLIEIMIVVLIIGMILGLVGPNFMKSFKGAQHKNARNQILLLGSAVEDYYLDMSEYPSKLEDLVDSPSNTKWDGPYLKPAKIPIDPWGEPYYYEFPGQHDDFDIYSYGADKAAGGEKANADIGNWE